PDRARRARLSDRAVERRPARRRGARTQEGGSGRTRQGSGRQSPAGSRDDRRDRRIRNVERETRQPGRRRGHRHVAEEDALAALGRAFDAARSFLATRTSRPVWPDTTLTALRAALGGPLPAEGHDAGAVVAELACAADRGIVATTGPRYFGFVTGGALPATLGAGWLTRAGGQNTGPYVMSPPAAGGEEDAGGRPPPGPPPPRAPRARVVPPAPL